MPKFLSFRRSLLLSIFFLALLASAIYLQVGDEIQVPPVLEMAICSVLEDCDSWISRAISSSGGSSGGSFSSGDIWNAPSASRDLGSSVRDGSDGGSPAAVFDAASYSSSNSLILNFDSSVSTCLFRTWGRLTLQGESTLPYLILNATLWDGDQLVEGTRYMIIEVKPGVGRDFDIRESCRLSPERGYSSLLEVEEAGGLLELEGFTSERRDCLVAEDDPRIVGVAAYRRGAASEEESGSPSVPGPTKMASALRLSKPVEKSQDEKSQEVEDSSEDLESEKHLISGKDPISGSSLGEPKKTDTEAEIDYKYVGSTTSDKYHRPDCRYAEKIKPENRITFSDVWEAREAGYSPCKVCNPE